MVTPQLMKSALQQADQQCMAGCCIHQAALSGLKEVLHAAVFSYATECLNHHRDPLAGTFEYGLHVGYELAQLERNERVPEN